MLDISSRAWNRTGDFKNHKHDDHKRDKKHFFILVSLVKMTEKIVVGLINFQVQAKSRHRLNCRDIIRKLFVSTPGSFQQFLSVFFRRK